MPPKISIVMPVWNGEKFVAETMDSVLAQTFRDFEFIIVDDGSSDGTVGILESYRDSRLRLLRQNHGGIVRALNYGIAEAQGSWIARQDADDISLPRRLESLWESVQRKTDCPLAFSAIETFGEGAGSREPRLARTRALLAVKMCWYCPITHSAVMFAKEAFVRAGGYLDSQRHAEDFGLWGRMLEQGAFAAVAEPLLKLRRHEGSISVQKAEAQSALARRIAMEHARRFMNLTEGDAGRVFELLSNTPAQRNRSDWKWFVTQCVPRLRWKSAELYAWIALETARMIGR